MRFLSALLLSAAAFVPALGLAQDQQMPFDLTAASITYDVSTSRVTATGANGDQAYVKSQNGDVWADTITYDLAANKVYAAGNVAYTDTTSTTLRVDRLELNSDLTQGGVEQLDVSVPELGSIATADSGTVSGTEYKLKNVQYSPCKTCEGQRKPWSITADEVVYRKDKSDMTYSNAVMDVYGVPVMYLPWLRHPVGPKQAKSGLLTPQFGKSQALGEEVTISGYVFSPNENADYTIRNRLMSRRGSLLSLERRQVGMTTNSEFKASYVNDQVLSKIRSHVALMAEKDFSESQRIGINAESASDDAYLSQYYERIDPYLPSTVYGEDAGDNHYYALSLTHFQDLSSTVPSAETAQVYPHIELERWFALDSGGQLSLQGDMVNIHRGTGSQNRRMIGEVTYKRPWTFDDGSKVTVGAHTRMDVYNITNSDKNGNYTRFLPEANVTWEKPFISASGYHTISPKVMGIVSPRGGNANDKVPNEDSVGYELDTSNLFESSRFAGRDRIETGPRLIYGVDNRWGNAERTRWRLFVGQSIRRFDDASLPEEGGASTNVSDWVGYVEAAPKGWINFSNSFRLDNSTFDLRRSDTSLRLGNSGGVYARLTHTFLDHGPEEIRGLMQVPLSDTVMFKSNFRKDLARDVLLETGAGITWVRDCYEIELVARRRGYRNQNLEPSTDYLLNFKLLTLGSDS